MLVFRKQTEFYCHIYFNTILAHLQNSINPTRVKSIAPPKQQQHKVCLKSQAPQDEFVHLQIWIFILIGILFLTKIDAHPSAPSLLCDHLALCSMNHPSIHFSLFSYFFAKGSAAVRHHLRWFNCFCYVRKYFRKLLTKPSTGFTTK